MTDAELLAAQHRIISLMPCACKLAWKHADSQPLCQRCSVLEEFDRHVMSGSVCAHGTQLGYDCTPCPRGVAQVRKSG